jgi:hypothetical protein
MPRTGSLHNGIIELFRPSEQPIDIEYMLASRQIVILADHLVRIVSSLFMVCKVTLGEHGLMNLQKCAGLATFFPTTSRMPGSCRGGITPTQIPWAVRQQAQTGSYSMLGRLSRSFKTTERYVVIHTVRNIRCWILFFKPCCPGCLGLGWSVPPSYK